MFEAALSKFVKSVGHDSLLPVASLDQANFCQPLQVVIKKNRRWYWQSAKYEVSPFQLNQLLTMTEPFSADECALTERKLTSYNKTYSFSLDGKIGGQLKALIDVELQGEDAVNVESKFGDITKVEVDQPLLMKTLENKQLDVKHEFLTQVTENARKVLCVIVGVAKLANEGSVHVKTDISGEEEIKAGEVVKKVVNEDEDVKIDDANEKTMTIPANTPLAYNICELFVKADGTLELMLDRDASDKGTKGGFEKSVQTDDEVDGLIMKAGSMVDDYKVLYDLSKEERSDLNKHLLSLCSSPLDVLSVFMMLKTSSRNSESQTVNTEQLKQKEAAVYILEKAGFTITDDGTLSCDAEKSELFNGLFCLFEALIELDDDETVALSQYTGEYAANVVYLIHSALEGDEEVKKGDSSVSILYKKSGPHQKFLDSLGFKIVNELVIAEDDNRFELEGAMRAVYALWLDPVKAQKTGSNCNIL